MSTTAVYINGMGGASGGAGSSGGTIVTTTGAGAAFGGTNGTYVSGTLQQMLTQMMTPMSKQEADELENLKKDHEVKLKLAKLATFKTLPSEIRQLVVNAYEWKTCYDKMNTTDIAKDPRLQELEAKETQAKGWIGTTGTITFTSPSMWQPYMFTTIDLPAGVTLEDIKKAHMEATLEEEMIKSETN
jgi:hypothetical protein